MSFFSQLYAALFGSTESTIPAKTIDDVLPKKEPTPKCEHEHWDVQLWYTKPTGKCLDCGEFIFIDILIRSDIKRIEAKTQMLRDIIVDDKTIKLLRELDKNEEL